MTDTLIHLPAVMQKKFGTFRAKGRGQIAHGSVRLDGRTIGLDEMDKLESELRGRVLGTPQGEVRLFAPPDKAESLF